MYIVLEESDYKNIAKEIDDFGGRSGSFQYSDLYIDVDFKLSIDGYKEAETNYYVITDIVADVNLSLNDVKDVIIDYDKNRLEEVVEKYIK